MILIKFYIQKGLLYKFIFFSEKTRFYTKIKLSVWVTEHSGNKKNIAKACNIKSYLKNMYHLLGTYVR